LNGEDQASDDARDRDGHAQVRLPETAEAGAPQVDAVALRRNADELGERVVHVKHLVVEDVLEDRAGGGVVLHDVAINGESARGRFLGDVQKGEQAIVGLLIDLEIVEAVAGGGDPESVGGWSRIRRQLARERRGAPAKEHAVAVLVDRMQHVETPEQGIGSQLGGAQDVASTVDLGLAEAAQLLDAPAGIAPDPAVNGRENPIEPGPGHESRGHDGKTALHKSDRAVGTQVVLAVAGLALIACAIAADETWLNRHFLPGFFVTHGKYVVMLFRARIAATILGALLVFVVRRPLALLLVRNPLLTFQTALAVVLAFVTAEMLLRRQSFRAAEEVPALMEPRRRLDPTLGWIIVPARRGPHERMGRPIEYAFDRHGYRVRKIGEEVDLTRPTVVFTGESIILGERLTWEETIPAQTGRMLDVQSANIAVSGYANDQAYLRLKAELPRFRHPVAAVTLFMPSLFDRNLDDDRPHLDAQLRWHPPERRWRLLTLARRIVRYRRTDTIEDGIASTRAVLRAGVELARERGTVPLIVVPQFGPESEWERELRRRILDEPRLPYVFVPLDRTWRVWPGGRGHPDERAAHAIAAAIAGRLREAGVMQSALPGH